MHTALKRLAIVTTVTAGCIVLLGCGGADSVESRHESLVKASGAQSEDTLRRRRQALDSIPPTVSVLGQSTIGSTGLIQLTGVAADDRQLHKVRWSNDRGGTGTATLSGTTLEATWAVDQIQLETGFNTISVTAEDWAGNVATAQRTINREQAPPTTPAPPSTPAQATGVTTIYEAEKGAIGGGAIFEAASNASGGWVVGSLNNLSAFTQCVVDGGSGGQATLVVRYSNGYSDSRSLSLYVNGVRQGQLVFLPTAGWNTFVETAPIPIVLAAGSNNVRIQRDANDAFAADIDYFEIVRSGAPAPTPPPAPAAAPAPAPAIGDAVFPLQVDSGKRYLVDSAGKPFMIQGDSAWSLIVQLTRDQVDLYLDDRRSRGFNTLLVNLIEHKFSNQPPKNVYGQGPFLTPGDYGTPNDAYFAHADWVIQRAAEKGFLLLLVPSYMGYNGGNEGWYQEMVANGGAKMREFGRYLGRRYASSSNIMWTHGGDYNPSNKTLINEMVVGIREFDVRSLNTAHTAPETAAADYWGGQSWLQVNSIYTYDTVYSNSLAQYARSGPMPFFFIEGRYENESDGTPHRVRVQAYHALLSGAMGQVFGNNPIWHFNGPGVYSTSLTWQQAVGGPGSQSMTHVRALFAPRSWWTLQPDASNTTLTGGLSSGQDRAVAARAGDRSYAIAYMPSIRSVTINLGQLAGPKVIARWYDPSSGIFSAVSGSPFQASGSQSFRPVANNASNFGDWALLLESTQ